MGVRLPGRDHDRHGVRRQAQQQAGEFPGQALQRGRGGAVAREGGRGRQPHGERVGAARRARRRRSRPARRELHCAVESDARRVARAPGRVLGRRGLALPVCLTIAVRTGAASRPLRFSRCRRPVMSPRRSADLLWLLDRLLRDGRVRAASRESSDDAARRIPLGSFPGRSGSWPDPFGVRLRPETIIPPFSPPSSDRARRRVLPGEAPGTESANGEWVAGRY